MKTYEYIHYPVIDVFSMVYNRVKNKNSVVSTNWKPAAMVSTRSWNILLADDDEDDKEIFIEALTEVAPQVKVNTVKNGAELMQLLSQNSGSLPDMIFLDLNMPCKSGEECLIEIRNNQKLKEIPVVIYSTSSNKRDIEKTFQEGASLYITKPSSFHDLKNVVKKFFSIDWTATLWKPVKDTFVFKP